MMDSHPCDPDTVAAYVAGALSSSAAAKFEQHVAECPACRLEVSNLHAALLSVESLPLPTPVPRSWEIIASALPEPEGPGRLLVLGFADMFRIGLRRMSWGLAGAAATVMIFLVLRTGMMAGSPARVFVERFEAPVRASATAVRPPVFFGGKQLPRALPGALLLIDERNFTDGSAVWLELRYAGSGGDVSVFISRDGRYRERIGSTFLTGERAGGGPIVLSRDAADLEIVLVSRLEMWQLMLVSEAIVEAVAPGEASPLLFPAGMRGDI